MISRTLAACWMVLVSLPAFALELSFRAGAPEFQDAARVYEQIWQKDGARISAAFESESGVSLSETRIEVVVLEAPSHSGGRGRPMRLRASYPEPVKRGTLVHELGHRYLDQLPVGDGILSTHQKLNLLLLPVWEPLWGADFVASQVAVESSWSDEYQRAWAWVLTLSPEARADEWSSITSK